MTEQHAYQNVSVKKNDRSEVSITAEIPADVAAPYRARAIKQLGKDVELPGFRKGHIPEHVLAERLGEQKIWEEIAEMTIAGAYPQIIVEQELRVIGQPRISVTKLAPGNPIAFTIEVALEPTVTLPDYKAIARDVPGEPTDNITVTDKEIEDVLTNLRTNKWKIDNKEKVEQGVEPKPDELPELTDAMLRELGDFTGMPDFMQKLRENLRADKERRARERRRIEIGEKIVEASTIPLPDIVIESELAGMLNQFKVDVERMGGSFSDYLAHIKKSEDDLKQQWRPDAERRAKLQLVLNEIAKQENIQPSEEDIAREIERVKQHVKDADDTRLRLYVETVLTNEAVFAFLEKQAETPLSQS